MEIGRVLLFILATHAATVNLDQTDPSELPSPVYTRYANRVFSTLATQTNWSHATNQWAKGRVDPRNELTPGEIDQLVSLFQRFMEDDPANTTQTQLNNAKKREVDQLRRHIIPRRKYLKKDFKDPSHLVMHHIRFTAEDMRLLLTAIRDHTIQWKALRDTNYKLFQMEKKFQEKLQLRHQNNDKYNKMEKQKEDLEKEQHKLSEPLAQPQLDKVWETVDGLPQKEYNPTTFFQLHDLDGNGFLDTDEIDLILESEFKKSYDNEKPGDDKFQRREEMMRMRDFVYENIDKNKDMLVDFQEFIDNLERHDAAKKWETFKNETAEFDDQEFQQFEKERVDQIRDKLAHGEKPDRYDFSDVPLLDENFLNATHVKVGDTLLQADNRSRGEREKGFKKHEMLKAFQQEQQLLHAKTAEERRRLEMQFADKHEVHMNNPLTMDQILKVWEVQDHKNTSEYNVTQFYHLHDINSDGFIDHQELRLLLITEINQAYKDSNTTLDLVELSEELETMREKAMDRSDRNKDGKIDLEEFILSVSNTEERDQKNQQKKLRVDKYWHNLEQKSSFTDEEYKKFRDEHIFQIRKLIADGLMPENYNYSDVPQLTGSFVNATHIQKDGVLIKLHLQADQQRYKDFKTFLMTNRYYLEEELEKEVSPEMRAKILKNLENLKEERGKNAAMAHVPLSEQQERAAWSTEDKMEEEEFSINKYFQLHDLDRDGFWSKEEVVASLMGELAKLYDLNDPSLEEVRNARLASWMTHVFESGDKDNDFHLDLEEVRFIAEENKKVEEELKKHKKDEEAEYTDEEFKQFRAEKERYP